MGWRALPTGTTDGRPAAGKNAGLHAEAPEPRGCDGANWASFHDDPEWKQVSAASESERKAGLSGLSQRF